MSAPDKDPEVINIPAPSPMHFPREEPAEAPKAPVAPVEVPELVPA